MPKRNQSLGFDGFWSVFGGVAAQLVAGRIAAATWMWLFLVVVVATW